MAGRSYSTGPPRPASRRPRSSGVRGTPVSALGSGGGRPYFPEVSEPITRTEIAAQVEASEARTDTKFAGLNAQLDALSEKLDGVRGGIWAIAALVLASLGVIIAVMAYGGQWFGLGLQSKDVLSQAAKDGAVQALSEYRTVTAGSPGEGQTATGPNGQKATFRNGQWVLIPQR